MKKSWKSLVSIISLMKRHKKLSESGFMHVSISLILSFNVFLAEAQTTRTWALTTGGVWGTASNWSPSGVPQANDNVVIGGNINGAITGVPAITLNNLTILGNCTFDAGANNNTITVNGIMTVLAGKTFIADKSRLGFLISSSGTANIDGVLTLTVYGQGGLFTCNGRLNMGASASIGGQGAFTLGANATLATASVSGISVSGTSGSIVNASTRTYSANANYIYNGTAAQSTGDGLPTGLIGSLTIDNPTTVTMVNASRSISSGSLNLVNGQFNAGSQLSLGNSNTISSVTINRSGGSFAGSLLGSNRYDVVYSGSDKITGPELSGSGIEDLTVQLDPGGAITLGANRTINGILTLTEGNLITGSFALTIANNAINAVSGGSVSSYVNGVLTRAVSASGGQYSYPIGTTAAYAPVTMNIGSNAGSGTLTGFTTDGDNSNISSSDINTFRTVNRSWSFTASGPLVSTSYSGKFEWVADQDPSFDFNNAIVGKYNGSTWNYPTIGSKTSGSIEIINVTGFGTYQIGKECQYTSITGQPSNIAICEGSTTDFTVTASGDGDLQYEWSKDEQVIQGQVLATLSTGLAGNYKVKVSGECRTATSDIAVLSYKAATLVSTDPIGGAKCAGDIIEVKASGEGEISYQWFLDGSPISGATNSTFTVNEAGAYTVSTTAECGTATSEAVAITMNTPTKINIDPINVEITYGEDAQFSIDAEGTGDLTYRWQVFTGTNWSNLTNAGFYSNTSGNTLNINDPNVSLDGLKYKCFVSGLCGTVESDTVTIKVNKALLTVTPNNATRIYGDTDPEFSAVISGFQYGEVLENSGVVGEPILTTTASIDSGVGNYDIEASLVNLSASNYTFTPEKGTLTITPATLTVQIDSLTKEYGDVNPPLTYTVSGFKNNQTISSINQTGSLELTVNANKLSGFGNYPITVDVNTLTAPNYEFNIIDGNLKVKKAILEITADNKSRLYGEPNPEFTFSVTGFKNDEDLEDSVMRGTPAYETEANESSNVDSYAINPTEGQLTSPNYEFTFKPGTITVMKAPLTIKAVDTVREYGEDDPVFRVEYTGFKNGQILATSDLAGEVAVSSNALKSSSIGDGYQITPDTGTLVSANYDIFFETGTLTIEKATLNVNVERLFRKYGESNPEPTYSFSGFKNSETEQSIGLSGQFELSVDQVATTPVGVYPIIIASNTLEALNYNFVIVKDSLVIDKAVLLVKADDKSRIYGDPDPDFTVSISGYKNSEDATLANLSGDPNYLTDAVDTSSVGNSYYIRPEPGTLNAPNYSFEFEGGVLTITKAMLIVKAIDTSRFYGEINPVYEASFSGFKNGEDYEKSDLSGQPVLNALVNEGTPVGTYQIVTDPGDLSSRNYDIQVQDGELEIKKAVLSVIIADKTKKYGDVNPPLTYSYDNFKNGENETSIGLNGAFVISVDADETTGVGEHPIQIDTNTLAASNYDFEVIPGKLIIERAVLDITAVDATREYGDPDPSFNITITGFKNTDDSATVISGQAAFTTNAFATSKVGVYEISPEEGELSAANYSFNFIKGVLTITPASLTVTAKDTSREYGESNPIFEAAYFGFKNNENFETSDLDGEPVLISNTNNESVPDTYEISVDYGSLLSENYILNKQNGVLTITKALLTITANDTSRVYGGANPSFTAEYAGFKNGQDFLSSGITGTLNLSTTAITSSPVGIYPIVESGAGLQSNIYDFKYVDGTLNITKATLTVSADNKTKTYGSINPTLTLTYTGLISGQTLAQSDVGGTVSLQTTAADTSSVGTYPITYLIQELVSNNYEIVYREGTLTVNKANITVSADNKIREYGDANPELTYALSGFVLNQDLTTSGVTGTPSLSTTATISSNAGNYAISPAIGSLTATNYAFVMANGSLTITKAVLTVKADDKSRNYGAANPAFTATYSGFKLGQTVETANLRGNPNFSTTATAASPVGTYAIVITEANLGSQNYTFAMVNGTLTVNKASLTVTANNFSRVYGNDNPIFTVSYSGFVNGQTLATSGITGVPVLSTTADASSDVGTYPIIPEVGTLSASNYSFNYVNGTLTITKASITITADTKIKIYGDVNPLFTATYSGFKLGQEFGTSGITGSPSLTTTATTSSNVGTYPITAGVGTLASTNYSFTYVNGSLIVGKAALIVSADDKSKTYGAANPALTVSYSGFKLGQTVSTSGVTGTPVTTTTATTASGAGTYPISVSQGTLASSNYAFTFINGTLTVNKAVLTVTADSKSRAYGASNPALTATYTGFVSGQTLGTSGVTGAPSLVTTADVASPVGTYPITITEGTLVAANYSFNYVDGTLTVAKAVITVNAANKSKLYGEAVPAMSYTLNGFVNGEDLLNSDVKGGPDVSTAATQASPVGIYPISVSVGTLSSANYSFSFVNANLVVNKATIVVKANDASRAYGAANPLFTSTFNGFVNGETLATSGITGVPSYTTTATAVSPVGTYPVTPATGTLSASNYGFSFENGTLTIGKAVLMVTADNKSRSYGSANPELTYSVTGFANGQTLTSIGVTGSVNLATSANVQSPVGSYPITLDGGTFAADNYTFVYTNGNLTVSKAVVTVSAQNVSRVYGSVNPSFEATFNGFVNGETMASSGISGTAGFTTTATNTSPVGTYPIVVGTGTLSASNYSFNFVNGTLTITKAALTVRADDKSKVFGSANPTLTATYSGFVNGETLASSGVTGAPGLTTTALTNSLAGKYPINVAQGTLASNNYSFNYTPGTLSVNMGVTFTKQDPICLDGTDGSITLTVLGGNGSSLTYSVDNGATYQSVATINGLGVGTYKLKVKDADGNESVVADAILNIEIARWIGTSGGNPSSRVDWANAANWSNNRVPSSITHVIIPAGFSVNVNGNAAVASVKVAAGSTLTVADGVRLTIAGKCGVLPE